MLCALQSYTSAFLENEEYDHHSSKIVSPLEASIEWENKD